jgi:predicted RNA-binding protein YlxR (DUF448 family)
MTIIYFQVPFFEVEFVRVHHADVPIQPEQLSHSQLSLTNSFRKFLRMDDVPKRSRVKLCNTVEIRTDVKGFNSGRSYYVRCESSKDCLQMAHDLRAFIAAARQRFQLRTPMQQFRDQVKIIYDSRFIQGFVGLLIVAVSDHRIHFNVEPEIYAEV